MSKPFLPKVLTANMLKSGNVVFLARDGSWTTEIADAWQAADKEEAQALEQRGAFSRDNNIVVDPYLIDVAIDPDGAPRPLRYREYLRTQGPTVRRDLGYQAG